MLLYELFLIKQMAHQSETCTMCKHIPEFSHLSLNQVGSAIAVFRVTAQENVGERTRRRDRYTIVATCLAILQFALIKV